MKHLTPEKVAWLSMLGDDTDDLIEDVDGVIDYGLIDYVDNVIDYLSTAKHYPPERTKTYRIKQQIAAGVPLQDEWFNATQILTGMPAEKLIEQWHPSKVPDVNRELHNAIRVFVDEYGIAPSKTKHGDLARLVHYIMETAGLIDDPDGDSEIPRNLIRAALKE